MELSSVGHRLLFITLLAGCHITVVDGQTGTRTRDPPNPSLPGVPLARGASPPADCGIMPQNCTYNTKHPDVNNCKKYYVCGFEGNWQSRVCTGPNLFDSVTLECQSRSTARCYTCATPTVDSRRPLPIVPSSTPPPPATTTPQYADSRDPACNLATPCSQGKVMPDPSNCHTYIQCNFNMWIVRSCGQGTNFDKRTLRCIFPDSATCQRPCAPAFPGRIECQDPLPLPCISGTKIGDPTDCRKFHVCLILFGTSSWQYGFCPKFFDPVLGGCSEGPVNCTAPCGAVPAPTPVPTTPVPTTPVPTTPVPTTPAPTTPAPTTPVPTTPVPSTPAPNITPTPGPTSTSTISSVGTTDKAIISKDITLQLPLGELCNSPRRLDHSSCTSARKGMLHRHPTNCQQYFVCIGNYWAPGACGVDEYWDISNVTCKIKPPNFTCLSFNCQNISPDSTATLGPPPTSSIGISPSTATLPVVTSSVSSSTTRSSTPAPPASTAVPDTSSMAPVKVPESTSSSVVVDTTSTSDRPVIQDTTSAPGPPTKSPTTSSAVPPISNASPRSTPSPLSSSSTPTSTSTKPPVINPKSSPSTPSSASSTGTLAASSSTRSSTPTTTTTAGGAVPTAGTTMSTTSGQSVTPLVSSSVSNITSTKPQPVTSSLEPQPLTSTSSSASTTLSTSPPLTTLSTTTTSSTTTSTTTPSTLTPSTTTTSTMTSVPTTGTSRAPQTSKSTPTSTSPAVTTPTSSTPTSPTPNLTTTAPITNTANSTMNPSTTVAPASTSVPTSKATLASSTTTTASISTASTTVSTVTNSTIVASTANSTVSIVPIATSSTPSPTPQMSSPEALSSSLSSNTSSTSPASSTKPSNMTNASSSLTTPTHSAVPSGSPVTSSSGSDLPNATRAGLSTPPSPPPSTEGHASSTTPAAPVFCSAEVVRGYTWPMTEAGDRAKGRCNQGRSGTTYRPCIRTSATNAMWGKPDFQLCVDKEYQEVLGLVASLQAPPPSLMPPLVMSTLPSVSQPMPTASQPMPTAWPPSTAPPRPTPGPMALTPPIMLLARLTSQGVRQKEGIPAGNLNASIEALDGLTRLAEEFNMTLTHMETEGLFTSAGNSLSIRNKMGWKAIREEDSSRGVTVMEVVDKIGQQIAMNSQGNPVHRRTASLAIRAEAQPKDELQTFDYTPDPPPGSTPEPGGIRDRVILEKETLVSLSKVLPGDMVAMWSTYYYTLSDLLPVEGEQFINSHVLSVSVQSLPHGQVLKPPVELHFAALNSSIREAVPHCSFWDFNAPERGEWSDEGCRTVMSESSGTVCACDHLTNFAILMSPTAATGMHAIILSLISVVGCLLSILGMLVTICLYVLSWKRVKSHHAAVLLNLCIALIIANTTFLAGVLRTENKMICTAVAAMLHFFYLVAFFMMFADGVQFILYVVQVFHVRRKKETFLLILTCWVIPAVIVAVTMSITRGEGYGTDDYCWLRKDSGLIAAFAVPAIIVMIANFVILCKILHTISNSKGSERNNRVKATIWNIAVMMPLLGLTWVFGLFSVNEDTIYFQYIFAICNSLQGFFIFFFHCALNKKMRQAVVERFSSRSSLSSSLRKSGGSNKSEKKKGGGKQANKKGKSKKPVISAPKPVGRPRAYVTPRMQGNPEGLVPTPEPEYMDIDEARRGMQPPEGPVYPPYQGVGNGSLQRPQDKIQQDGNYHSKEHHNHSFDMRPEMHYEDVDQINVGIMKDDRHGSPIRPMSQHPPGNHIDRDPRRDIYYGSPESNRRRAMEQQQQQQQQQGWSPLQPRPSMSMDDLRMVGRQPPVSYQEGSPWMPYEEDPYLFPSPSGGSEMEMQMNPLQVTSQHQRAITFDPRRAIARRSPYAERCRRMGSGHSRSLDRLDSRRGLPRRYNESAAGISMASMHRYASKEKGNTYILLEPETYENLSRFRVHTQDGIMPPQHYPLGQPQGGHISEEPVYMQIDDVTQVDSQMSLDYMAGRA